ISSHDLLPPFSFYSHADTPTLPSFPTRRSSDLDAYERVARYYVSQMAYLAGRLDAMREGDGTVLDNSCLLFVSNMFSGSQHDSRSEEHTSELQSRGHLVCRLLLEKKKVTFQLRA